MTFDPDNIIVKLCAQGMALEGEGRKDEAHLLYVQAWSEAKSEVEKCISAHYVARHQESVSDKLKWDELALQSALLADTDSIKEMYPSLYLNIGKCHEDLNNRIEAKRHYDLGLAYSNELPEGGYNSMIKSGILNGLKRLSVLI